MFGHMFLTRSIQWVSNGLPYTIQDLHRTTHYIKCRHDFSIVLDKMYRSYHGNSCRMNTDPQKFMCIHGSEHISVLQESKQSKVTVALVICHVFFCLCHDCRHSGSMQREVASRGCTTLGVMKCDTVEFTAFGRRLRWWHWLD